MNNFKQTNLKTERYEQLPPPEKQYSIITWLSKKKETE